MKTCEKNKIDKINKKIGNMDNIDNIDFSWWSKDKRNLKNFNQLKKDIIENFKNQNLIDKPIIAMLSGGKDSSTALALAKDLGLNIVLAVNFTHKWSWEIPKNEVKKITKKYNVPLRFCDITPILTQRIQNGDSRGKNVCKICKTIMKEQITKICYEERIYTVLTGESGLEKIAGPILEYINKEYGYYNYNIMELTPIPKKYKNINFFRPLIRCANDDIAQLQKYYNININRVWEVGNKIGYWREGCCLQYADDEAYLSEKLFDELYYYNNKLTELGRKYKFRASIKFPSKKLFVLPKKKEYFNLVKENIPEINDLLNNKE